MQLINARAQGNGFTEGRKKLQRQRRMHAKFALPLMAPVGLLASLR